ncbi:MAG: hypothetical protein IJI87_04305 [Mogibacterium sp.]|nr:hypothetical protein [Mogibacterium sp.]
MVTNRKRAVCIIAVLMILLLGIPSFASSGIEDAEKQDPETIETTQQEVQEELKAENESETEDPQSIEDDSQAEKTTEPADVEAKEDTEPEYEDPAPVEQTPKMKAAPLLKAASGLPANNTKVSYTSAGSHPVKFTVQTGGNTFKGTCATLGVDNAKSGKATVKVISNNSKIAKLVYYYGYQKGWWQGANSTKKATTVIGFTDKNCTENAKQCIEALIQVDNMGWKAFWAARKVGNYRMYSTDEFMKQINKLYVHTDVSKITIPDNVVFEMFHGETSSSKVQDFYVWRYSEIPPVTVTNGFVAVEKVSGDVSITE